MPRTGWTPSLVPFGADRIAYLVIDRFGRLGTVYRETEVERADLEIIIADLVRAIQRPDLCRSLQYA